MKRSYEEAYLEAEQTHPWFVARRDLFSSLLTGPKDQEILDGGCGSGIFLRHLRALGYERIEGFEPSAPLREASRRQGAITVHRRFPEKIYDAIFLLDVLEHVEDDEEILRTVFDHLGEGGRLYLSVPAHPSLWSGHDEVNMHRRRYTRAGLRRLLPAAGFQVERLSYWNMLLFPPVALRRLLWKGAGSLEIGRALAPFSALAGLALRLENAIVLKTDLPLGLSLIAVARRGTAAIP
jgi:SAM-dependent methyltransferase